MRAPEETQTAWLLDAARGTRLQIPILLAITAGMRRGEILAARWQDVDCVLHTVTVRRSLQEMREGLFFKEPKGRRPGALSASNYSRDAGCSPPKKSGG
jgi:integrase